MFISTYSTSTVHVIIIHVAIDVSNNFSYYPTSSFFILYRCTDTIALSPLQPFDPSNTAISDTCKYCKKCRCLRAYSTKSDQPSPQLPVTDSSNSTTRSCRPISQGRSDVMIMFTDNFI